MQTRTEFEARLDALLDVRGDPLEDPQICAYLEAHPEDLGEFARHVAGLRAMPQLAHPRLARPTPMGLAAVGVAGRVKVAALVIAAGVAAALLWRSFQNDHAAAGVASGVAARGRILMASLSDVPREVGVTDTVRVSTTLLDQPHARLEVFAQWGLR